MEKNPKVSIIISTYNRPDKLKRAIESVQAQTFKGWEVIVVHDGDDERYNPGRYLDLSDKLSAYCIEHFGSDTRPKNFGIKQAKGEYIAFLDDDCAWRPDHLQALVKELDSIPEIDLVYGDRWLTDEDGQIPPQLGVSSDFDPYLLMRRNYIDTSDVLVRRAALWDVGGFDEEQKKYIDWNLWVRLVKDGKRFKRVPLILTDYMVSSDSKSKKVLTKREEAYQKETGQFANIPDWDPIDCEIRQRYLDLHIRREPRVAIFSLTYDRLDYTRACFESLYKTAGYPFEHHVIDNGSKDATVGWMTSENGMVKLQNNTAGTIPLTPTLNDANRGISAASNQALNRITKRKDPYDIIGKVDNDCLFLNHGWLKAIVNLWKANHRLALSPYVQGLRDNPGGAPRQHYGHIRGELLGMTKHLGGLCHFVDASAYKDFRWDETDFLHGVQDLEFSQYLAANGYQMAYLENWYVEHYKGTEGQEKDYPDYFERRKSEKTTRHKND